jgi:hypothetical protein
MQEAVSAAQARIVLDDEATWPTDLLEYLGRHGEIFLGWELQRSGKGGARVRGWDYDRVVYGLRDVLSRHLLHGYHCTRLTDVEIEHIWLHGMQLPSGALLRQRITSLQETGLIEPLIADRLRAENQADDSNRTNRIWFCFFPPHRGGQHGIEPLFRSWGGEALYNSHESDPVTGQVLGRLGTPCLVEADIPIASLETHSFLGDKIARQFLITRGLETSEPVDHEDRAKRPIPASYIRRVIRFPEPDFFSLAQCADWTPPLV